MGCAASTAATPLPIYGATARYLDLKDLDRPLAGKKAALPKKWGEPAWDDRMEDFQNLDGTLRIECDDGTEHSVPRPPAGLSPDQADKYLAGQQLAQFIAATGFGQGKVGIADRQVNSIGGHFDLSRAQLSVHAALNQTGALKALLRDPSQDPNRRDPDGARCPLHWAAARGHVKCAQMLLSAGANPAEIDRASRLTCSELAEERGHPELAELIRGAAVVAARQGGPRVTRGRAGHP